MSMISAQCDELRVMAQLEKSLERPAIARILSDAADTIWQLRDDLQRANAENAKLRELVADMLGYYAMPNDIDYKREAALLERARELGIEVYE